MKEKNWTITKYEIISPKAYALQDDRMRIVFISDLHDVDLGDHNKWVAEKVKELAPDLILIGGDIVLGKPSGSMGHAMELLDKLPKEIPSFAANGNHEYRLKIYPEVYGAMYEQYREGMKKAGVTLLEDRRTVIQINGMKLAISGYELPREYYDRFYRGGFPSEKLQPAFLEREEDAFEILMAHHPKYFKDYAKWNPDLILSGHYHGGIVRLLGKYPVIGNDFTLFPRYAYGHYKQEDTHMVVSAGMGDHTLPIRIWNPRELVVIEVRRPEAVHE